MSSALPVGPIEMLKRAVAGFEQRLRTLELRGPGGDAAPTGFVSYALTMPSTVTSGGGGSGVAPTAISVDFEQGDHDTAVDTSAGYPQITWGASGADSVYVITLTATAGASTNVVASDLHELLASSGASVTGTPRSTGFGIAPTYLLTTQMLFQYGAYTARPQMSMRCSGGTNRSYTPALTIDVARYVMPT